MKGECDLCFEIKEVTPTSMFESLCKECKNKINQNEIN